jgi:hypothetical protein
MSGIVWVSAALASQAVQLVLSGLGEAAMEGPLISVPAISFLRAVSFMCSD